MGVIGYHQGERAAGVARASFFQARRRASLPDQEAGQPLFFQFRQRPASASGHGVSEAHHFRRSAADEAAREFTFHPRISDESRRLAERRGPRVPIFERRDQVSETREEKMRRLTANMPRLSFRPRLSKKTREITSGSVVPIYQRPDQTTNKNAKKASNKAAAQLPTFRPAPMSAKSREMVSGNTRPIYERLDEIKRHKEEARRRQEQLQSQEATHRPKINAISAQIAAYRGGNVLERMAEGEAQRKAKIAAIQRAQDDELRRMKVGNQNHHRNHSYSERSRVSGYTHHAASPSGGSVTRFKYEAETEWHYESGGGGGRAGSPGPPPPPPQYAASSPSARVQSPPPPPPPHSPAWAGERQEMAYSYHEEQHHAAQFQEQRHMDEREPAPNAFGLYEPPPGMALMTPRTADRILYSDRGGDNIIDDRSEGKSQSSFMKLAGGSSPINKNVAKLRGDFF